MNYLRDISYLTGLILDANFTEYFTKLIVGRFWHTFVPASTFSILRIVVYCRLHWGIYHFNVLKSRNVTEYLDQAPNYSFYGQQNKSSFEQNKSLTKFIETSSTLKKILANYWTIIFLSWLSCELTVVAKLLGVCKYKYDSPITLHLPKLCFPSLWILNHNNKILWLMTTIASGLCKSTYEREYR